MKKFFVLFSALVLSIIVFSQTQYPVVVMETTMGVMKFELYDNTFRHSDNFVKLVKDGYYNGQLFHRVIKDFMIQAGDNMSNIAKPGESLGHGGKKYTIPAEFFPEYYHRKGALAAARQPDNINPNKESSGSQFYIVQGQVFDTLILAKFVEKKMHVPFTPEQTEIYVTQGGTPHLDYNYTVFGMIMEGLDVLENISKVPTDTRDRPLTDVRIIKMFTEENKYNEGQNK